MLQQGVLKAVVEALERVGMNYMLTGSVVSSLQGEPRATHDIDVVVAVRTDDLDQLLSSFPSESFYFDKEAAREAVTRKSVFGLIDLVGGAKVDFWPLTDDAFDQCRFSRRQRQNLLGVEAFVSSPEDTILMKLRWAVVSCSSRRQLTDATRVYEVQRERLDLQYLEEWVERIGVRDLWERIRREADSE